MTLVVTPRSLVVLALLVCSGCYPLAGPIPSSLSEGALTGALQKYPNESAATLEHGRELFTDNCNDCHDYPDVWAVNEANWPGVMKRMGKNATMKQDESDLVLHFVLSAKADTRPADAPPPPEKKKKK